MAFGNWGGFPYGFFSLNVSMNRPHKFWLRSPAWLWAGWVVGVVVVGCDSWALRAAETLVPPALSAPAVAVGGTNRVPFRRLEDGCIQIGQVRLDPRRRTLSFPALLNMNEGIIEYLLVSTTGKTHESLLRTEAEPFHIQTAMLLLGAKGAGDSGRTNAPAGGQISAEALRLASAVPLVGEQVTIGLEWVVAGKTNQCALEDWVVDVKGGGPMSRGAFVFSGSRMFEGLFLAQQEGSIISVITDLCAVFNNPRARREDEDNWRIAGGGLPALNSPVRVTITVPVVAGVRELKSN